MRKRCAGLFGSSVYWLLALAALAVLNCKGKKIEGTDGNCVDLHVLRGAAYPPSNVVLLFSAETCEGEPLAGLTVDDFVVSEDSDPVSVSEHDLTLLPNHMGYQLFGVLLMDVSGPLMDSPALADFQDVAKTFVERLAASRPVAIYVFDGRAALEQLVAFSTDVDVLRDGIDSLSGITPVDPSTNLNGAVVSGLTLLDDEAERSGAPIGLGTLVVVTDGTDEAGRASNEDVVGAVQASNHEVHVIGLGPEVDQPVLESFGKDGAEFAADAAGFAAAFTTTADSVETANGRLYVLAYCSMKRAGQHAVTLEIDGTQGSLQFDFSADGFQVGCDTQAIVDACIGRECGAADDVLWCGGCGVGQSCSLDGQCVDEPGCGNGAIDLGEDCDGQALGGQTCQSLGFPGGELACTALCVFDMSACDPPADCGDGNIQAPELCDGANLDGQTCQTLGLAGGTLTCNSNCTFDTSGCLAEICGNGIREGSEQCDASDLAGETCQTLGYPSGTLACAGGCTFDTSACDPPANCGNGTIEPPEDCDGSNLNGQSCEALGFAGGTLACAGNCDFDTSGCLAEICGNGIREGSEECDASDLAGQSCQTLGYPSGTLGCTGACTFDMSACDPPATCGNDTIEPPEQCDGPSLGGQTCVTLGFAGGTLQCGSNCTFDTSGCLTEVCGNGIREGSEQCDWQDFGNETCQTLGFPGGTLACTFSCTFDTTGCDAPPTCGNGTVESPEECDDGNTTSGDGCSDNCHWEHHCVPWDTIDCGQSEYTNTTSFNFADHYNCTSSTYMGDDRIYEFYSAADQQVTVELLTEFPMSDDFDLLVLAGACHPDLCIDISQTWDGTDIITFQADAGWNYYFAVETWSQTTFLGMFTISVDCI